MLCPSCRSENERLAGTCASCGRRLPDPPLSEDAIRVARLVREAARGVSPPREGRPATREREEDDILRSLLSSLFQINRKAKERLREIDRGSLAALYTAKSFSSPESLARATRAVRQLLRANERVAEEMRQVLRRTRQRVESRAWAPAEKRAFWREAEEGFAAKFQFRSDAMEKQRAWTEATVDVYEFVLCHSEELRFDGKTARAGNREIGQQFIDKLKRAKQCREVFRAASGRIHREQSILLGQWGIDDLPGS